MPVLPGNLYRRVDLGFIRAVLNNKRACYPNALNLSNKTTGQEGNPALSCGVMSCYYY